MLFLNKNNWFLELRGKTLNLWQNSGVTAISFISPRLILFSLFKPNIKQILNFSISDNIGATKRLKKNSLWYKKFWSLSRLATYKPTEVVRSHYILLIIRCLPSPPPSKELSYSPDHQVSPLSPPLLPWWRLQSDPPGPSRHISSSDTAHTVTGGWLEFILVSTSGWKCLPRHSNWDWVTDLSKVTLRNHFSWSAQLGGFSIIEFNSKKLGW